ncbi:hypothetical protein TRAPUB_1280 [Trametes pubescens]|uniref:Uncharacterized protein n=1 Tax=Trametes pubescens TaxID=154538 RepID=A0A1M2VJT8_TRAPU|nr:hypothetical protein TRAPUB_1280 [Trametes pubescens]
MVQGGFPHVYTLPYGAPLPYAVATHQSVPSSSSHQMVRYPPMLASLSRTGPVVPNPPPFLPLGMPLLMPILGLSWAPVPDHHLLVAHTAGCTCCTEFVQHYQAAINNTSFRDAMMFIQTRLQTQFWAYFEEHVRSREGESRNEHARQVEDLEQQLRAALAEGHALHEE